MLAGRRTKHRMRAWYALCSLRRLKQSLMTDDTHSEYWQAGKSVTGIRTIEAAGELVRKFASACRSIDCSKPR
jgi:nitronate monooxygenase